MSGVLRRVLSHYRPGAWSHPDEDVCWGNPKSLVVVVVVLVLRVLGHSQSLERGNRWIEELFRTEIWSWDRWTVWAGGRRSKLAPVLGGRPVAERAWDTTVQVECILRGT